MESKNGGGGTTTKEDEDGRGSTWKEVKREEGNELPRGPRYWKMPAESRISRESRVLRMDSGDVCGGRARG